jgi:hypothetical protein
MKKSTETALSVGIAYLLMKIGTGIWRHPKGSAVTFTALFVVYVLDGAPFWEAVHSARSLAAIYAIVFIIGLACTGRGFAAFLWFLALMFGLTLSQAWIECAQTTC